MIDFIYDINMILRSSKIVTYIPQGRKRKTFRDNGGALLLYYILVLQMVCFIIFSSMVTFIFYITF